MICALWQTHEIYYIYKTTVFNTHIAPFLQQPTTPSTLQQSVLPSLAYSSFVQSNIMSFFGLSGSLPKQAGSGVGAGVGVGPAGAGAGAGAAAVVRSGKGRSNSLNIKNHNRQHIL